MERAFTTSTSPFASPRGWLVMKPLLSRCWKLLRRICLAMLQEYYPQANLAYFNTHTLAEDALAVATDRYPPGAHARAVACVSRDSEACFSGVDVQVHLRNATRSEIRCSHATALMLWPNVKAPCSKAPASSGSWWTGTRSPGMQGVTKQQTESTTPSRR